MTTIKLSGVGIGMDGREEISKNAREIIYLIRGFFLSSIIIITIIDGQIQEMSSRWSWWGVMVSLFLFSSLLFTSSSHTNPADAQLFPLLILLSLTP